MENASKVINFTEERNKKIMRDEGLDPEKLMLCFNGYQFTEILKKIFIDKQDVNDVLKDNQDLYMLGYFDDRVDKIHVIKENS